MVLSDTWKQEQRKGCCHILFGELAVQLASQAEEQVCHDGTKALWILILDKPQQNNQNKTANTVSFTKN